MNNNVVKADAMEKPAQSNNAKGGQQGATGEANGTQGDPINHAKKLMGGDLPDDIANRVVDDKTTGKLIEQTDEYGNLPTIVSAKNADGKIFNWVEIDLHPHINSWFLKVLKK